MAGLWVQALLFLLSVSVECCIDYDFGRRSTSVFRMMIELLSIALFLLALLSLAYWAAALIVAIITWRTRPSIRRGLDLPEPDRGWPSLSIVLPAHNEAEVIGDCVASLRSQDYPNLQIIIVLDRCTDGSSAIAHQHADEDPRVLAIENDHCPDSWAGKCHAAAVGAKRATGDLLLFTDADTVFDPRLCRASVALLLHEQISMLSLLSTLTYRKAFERIVQPVAVMVLFILYPIWRINRDVDARPLANGQFMLFDGSWYDAAGGHAGVKEELLEDIALARAVHKAGGRVRVALADHMLICAMYDSLTAFTAGWRRIFLDACKRKPGRLIKYAIRTMLRGVLGLLLQIVVLAAAIPMIVTAPGLAGLFGWLAIAAVLTAWLLQLVALMVIYRTADAPLAYVLTFPLGSWVVSRVLFEAAGDLKHRRPVKWGGKTYILEPR